MIVTDFHSHCLPGIDDGAQNIKDSLEILDVMAENGIQRLVCTPHYYRKNGSIEKFTANRNNAYEQLKPHLKPEYPQLLMGAEVLFSHELKDDPHLHDLCIEGTDYLLLEMPYKKFSSTLIHGVEELADTFEVKLIIAHIERYLHFNSMESLLKLMSLDVLGQINAKSIASFRQKKDCIRLLRDGYAQCIGSDMHNLRRGDITVNNAEKILDKKIGSGYYGHLMNKTDRILQNCDMSAV